MPSKSSQTSSTMPRPLSAGHSLDGDYPDISIPSHVPSTTLALHPQIVGDVRSTKEEDGRASISIASASGTTNHSEGGNHGDTIQKEMVPVTSEDPSFGCGAGAAQNTEATYRVGPGLSSPTEVPTVAINSEKVPSISLFQGSSNLQISNTNINAIAGNATVIRFGDGQFTEIQRNLICDYIAKLAVLPDIKDNLKKHVLTQSIISLPRAEAVFNDYQTKKKSGPCFEGTRVALLREMADWVTCPGVSRVYVLSGLAGIGKSTVAYTIASRAADLNLLGASFFFSRDEADRNNAKRFFSTLAYQLCVYNETFSKAIGDMLLTERGSAATTKDPQDQLQALILEPLRSIVQSHSRPILIVVDALDECDEDDAFSVIAGLSQLVRDLPSFKIILTTRPQPYLDHFFGNRGNHKIFHLQDIEDKVVDDDIRLYLNYSLSSEQVLKRYPKRQWCANDVEISSLVRAVGRLFIIASTAVRYIFDKSASNPAAQMQKLLRASAQDHTPFRDLDQFYTVILRNAVPENCDDHIVSRYQSVVGTIIFIQRPLPVPKLAHLIHIDVVEIREVLDNLQSVILLGGDDVPRIYHKSFPDYLTDLVRCQDPGLRIDQKIRHTQIAMRCFEIMDRHLKYNILGLGDPARFMNNEDGLKEGGITDEQLEEKIPQQLRYACVYWVKHLEVINIQDGDLMYRLEKFADDHILYWFEVLSLIGKLDTAHRAIGVVMKLLKTMTSDSCQLFSDASRFISKFYEIIEQSALHTYYSALAFTPTNTIFYRRYLKNIAHNTCTIDGGQEKWDALIANLNHGDRIDVVKFSLDSAFFVSFHDEYADLLVPRKGKLKIWDAITGTPISTIPGDHFAIPDDFSTVASSEDKTITLYNANSNAENATITTSSKVRRLAVSSENSRVVAALSDRTVWLWDGISAELIDNFDGFEGSEYWSRLQISPTGTRFAYSSMNGTINLRDGISGRFITCLECGSEHDFEFLDDGSRIASLSRHLGLRLWNSENGRLINTIENVDHYCLTILANERLLATANHLKVKLWSETNSFSNQIGVFETESPPQSMAFSLDSILAVASYSSIKLYDVKTQSLISILPVVGKFTKLTFSPDCTRLASNKDEQNVCLWDVRDIDDSGSLSKYVNVTTAVALSRDCSRLACGFEDGTVELWETSPIKQRITPLAFRSRMKAVFFRISRQSRHTEGVTALEFTPDGELFTSWTDGRTIKLWSGKDGVLRGTLKAPNWLRATALSNTVLVAAWNGGVMLWNLNTLGPIHSYPAFWDVVSTVSIAENSALIAIAHYRRVSLLDVATNTIIATFDLLSYIPSHIRTMTFLSDNSQLMVESDEGVSLSLNLIHKRITKGQASEHLTQLQNTPLWYGIPIWHHYENEEHSFSLFSQHKSLVPVLRIPRQIPLTAWTQGKTMIALRCGDGRIILLRLPISNVN